jgi:hypothetical protein
MGRNLNRRERRKLARQMRVPLPRRFQQFQRLADPMTNQHRMEVNQMILASRAARKARHENELVEIVKGEEDAA